MASRVARRRRANSASRTARSSKRCSSASSSNSPAMAMPFVPPERADQTLVVASMPRSAW